MDNEISVGIEKICGQADSNAACGVFTKRITFENGVVGTIVSTILVSGGDGDDKQTYLRDIFEISAQKLENGDGKPLTVLKEACESCKAYIEQRSLEVSFVNALIYKNAFYCGRYKENVHIWVFEGSNSSELKFEYGSGLLMPAQIFLIGTEKFFSTFDTAVLSDGAPLDLEGIIDGLATEISANVAQSEIGVSIVYVKDQMLEEELKEDKQDKFQESEVASPKAVDGIDTEQEKQEDLTPAPAKSRANLLGIVRGIVLHLGAFGIGIVKAVFSETGKLKKGDGTAILRLRRNMVVVAFLILLILGISALFTIRSEGNKKKLAEFNDHMKTASSKLNEGEAIIDLNRDRARTAFSQAENEVKAALAIEPKSSDAKDLEAKIAQKLKDSDSKTGVNFQTFADLGEPVFGLSGSGKNLVLFSSSKMYQLDNDGKEKDKIDLESNVTSGYFTGDSGYFISGAKVFKRGFSDTKPKEVADSGGAFDISVFLGNVYLLGSSQIAKYVPIEGGYAKSVDYLNNPEQFSASSRFAIDGSVWVTSGKSINKYLRGAKEDFSITGLSDENGQFGEIFTNAQSENLYVLDISNSALLVIKKDGVYQKAYQSPEFSKASSILVDEAGGKMYISDGSKVLQASL